MNPKPQPARPGVPGEANTTLTTAVQSPSVGAEPTADGSIVTRKIDPDATHAADWKAVGAGPSAAMPNSIGGVTLIRLLGKGGMGQVFLGHHQALDIDVAVKLLKPGIDEAERFLQEARSAVRIQHEHVVRVFNAGAEQGRMYLVMELVTGGDLAQLVRQQGRLSWQTAVNLAIQAAEGLGAAHRVGIVHRDVKPANFMLTSDGKLKVADLGLAKQQRIAEGGHELTQTGVIMGTPSYMAPEQAVDTRTAGPPADVYALGVSLYHVLTGELPFKGDTTTKLLLAHLNDPVPDIRRVLPTIPESVARALEQLLAKDPTARPADGVAAAQLLRAAVAAAGETPSVATAPRGERARVDLSAPSAAPLREARPIVLAAGIALAVGILVVLGMNHRTPAATATNASSPAAAVPEVATPAHAPASPASSTDALAPSGQPVAPAAPAVAADPWQTPPRAVFIIAASLPAETAGAIESALIALKVKLVERQEIDQLVKEQTLIEAGRINAVTAAKLGRLVGGHVALFGEGAGEQIHLRAVAVETGEVTASEVLKPAEAAAKAVTMVEQTLAALPAQGRLERAGDTFSISLGRQHGVRSGDRFRVYVGTLENLGNPAAVATVAALSETSATVEIKGTVPEHLPALVQRVEP